MNTDNPTPEQTELAPVPKHDAATTGQSAHSETSASHVATSDPHDASHAARTASAAAAHDVAVHDAEEPDMAETDASQEEEAETTKEAAAEEPPAVVPNNLHWYVVKVQSNREESIKEAIERRVKIEGLQDSFGQIVVPTEKVSEMRKGKRYIREKKLLPGYLMVQVEFNDRMLYLFRETSGVGDFVGAGIGKPPLPMSDREVQKWVGKPTTEGPVTQETGPAPFSEGDRVKVKDGMFSGMEGVVKQLLETKGAVIVELTIFGRPVPVELEYWQVDFTE